MNTDNMLSVDDTDMVDASGVAAALKRGAIVWDVRGAEDYASRVSVAIDSTTRNQNARGKR